MNIQYEIVNKRVNFGEEVADILVKHSKEIKPFYIDQQLLASLIDEIPILSIAALFANGKSILKNAKELRVKESDRIKSIVENMRNLGVEIEEFEDGFALNPIRNLKKTYINTHFDHRIAMSFSILKSLGYELEISETKSPETSYPTFFEHLRYLET